MRVGAHGKADVEFIADATLPKDLAQSLVGQGILVNVVQDFNVLLEKTIPMKLAGVAFTIPAPAHFVFHKLLTFVQRNGAGKRGKDLYYTYFVLSVCPHQLQLVEEVRGLVENHPRGGMVKDHLVRFFQDEFDEGTRLVVESAKTTSLGTLVSNLRQDIFEKFAALESLR